MFTDSFLESSEEGGGGGGGGGVISLLGNEDEPILRRYILSDQPGFFGYLSQAVSVKTNSLD